MRVGRPVAAVLFSSLCIAAAAQTKRVRPAVEAGSGAAQALPIARVSLYKNGVGFFEHAGRVSGSETVTIDFTTAQLNDVLQTLTAVDLQGGKIAGAGYNSTTPLEQQLKTLPLALGPDASSADFYNAIRGARVEVRAGSGAGAVTITGRLLAMEVRTAPGKDDGSPGVEKRFLTVVSDAGAVRTVELTGAMEVRLLDAGLHGDVTRYLQLLASTRNSGLRHLTLQDNGTGVRDLRVSYLSEVPIWKSTYRILFTEPVGGGAGKQTATLQGWSVVDNTTGSDWVGVQLSLIAGAPQSFLQPLSTPYYARRQEIPLPQEAQLAPQTHESGNDDLASPTKIPKEIKMLKEDGAPSPVIAGVAGMSSMDGSAGGSMAGIETLKAPMAASRNRVDYLRSGGLEPVYEESASNSIVPQTTTRAFDDYFEYKIMQPVTIRKNESALVPILQTKVDAERVTLWSARQPTALRALWITNNSNLTLDRGSFTIVEDGSFGGEGLLDPIHPAERRLLSYAADQAVRVTADHRNDTRRVQRVTVAKGVLKETTAEVQEVEYLVKNAAAEARTVVVEQPVRTGWTLDADPKPTETTATAYRFRVEAKAGETVRLHLGERRTLEQVFYLANTSDEQLTVILRNAKASPALLAQLEPVFAAKRALSDLDRQIDARQNSIREIGNDQKRVRENLAALKGSAEERALAKRYTGELTVQEDRLAGLTKELGDLRRQRDVAQGNLDRTIQELSLDDAI